jgi:hypothetical protein
MAGAYANGQQTADPRPAYQLFRYDEDWSNLADPANRSESIDALKYIPLGISGWFVTISGEIRERYELLDQPGFGLGPKDTTGYLLQRYLLSSDFHFGSRLRFFTEFQSALENGRTGGPRPTDEDRLDVAQAFLDWKVTSPENHDFTIRLGRQELGFGSGRLISPAEGLNVRRGLDGVRLTARFGKIIWNATALRLVEVSPGIFDDVPDHRQTFYGTGLTAPHPFWKQANVSLYSLNLDHKNSVFVKGAGRTIRHTIGSRSWKTAGPWDLNYEGIFQFGSFRGMPIRAWAFSEDTGFTLSHARFQPRFSIRADVASGDPGRSHRVLGSFDPLFPAIPVYSGPSGLLGPTNLIDATPSARLRLNRFTTLTLESSSFWRESLQDGVYSPFITPLRSGAGRARYVATAPSATVGFQVNRHVFCSAIYTRFFTGEFFNENPPNRSVNYVATWVSYRF